MKIEFKDNQLALLQCCLQILNNVNTKDLKRSLTFEIDWVKVGIVIYKCFADEGFAFSSVTQQVFCHSRQFSTRVPIFVLGGRKSSHLT